jgi:hypothetical protein
MKDTIILVGFLLTIFSCSNGKRTTIDNEATLDSIYNEFASLALMTYYHNDRIVPEYELSSTDTITVTEDINISKNLPLTFEEKEIFIVVKKGQYLIPIQNLGQISQVNVYDKDWKLLTDGYKSNKWLKLLNDPHLNDHKVMFYDRHKILLTRVTKRIADKYKLTEDSILNIVYSKLETDYNYNVIREITKDR